MSKHKIIYRLFILFLLSFNALQAQDYKKTTINGKEFYKYQIEKSEGFYSIGKKFGVTQEELLLHNPELKDGLKENQTILIPVQNTVQTTTVEPPVFTRKYVAESKETIFSISQKFGIKPQDLISANPELKEGLKAGQTITIPLQKEIETTPAVSSIPAGERKETQRHLVERKETIFSISKKYNISQDELIQYNPELKDGLKTGKIILIPIAEKPTETYIPATTIHPGTSDSLLLELQQQRNPNDVIKVAYMLPFVITDSLTYDPATDIFYDFYNGALLAIDSLKKTGISVDVYTYDTGKDNMAINKILRDTALKNVDIIFGPAYTEQISPVAKFAKEHKIRLVIPFSSRTDETFTNTYIFQPNPNQDTLNKEIINTFANNFGKQNIVILRFKETLPNSVKSISDSITSVLQQQGISYSEIIVPTDSASVYQNAINKLLSDKKENIILPMTVNPSTLARIMPSINKVQKNFSLFGFEEWTMLAKTQEEIFMNTTYTCSLYHLDYQNNNIKHFFSKYLNIFGNEASMNFPHFNLLGYDMTFFFLKGINKFGASFEQNLNQVPVNTLQIKFDFEKVNENGGYMNKNIFLIKYENGKNYKILDL
jgi:LysM repeat protein